jgi:hypothetical protein
MKVRAFTHRNVAPCGHIQTKKGGAVHANGAIIMSQDNGGCDIKSCNCSPGHWITILMPRTSKGLVRGMSVSFKDRLELLTFLDKKELAIPRPKKKGTKIMIELDTEALTQTPFTIGYRIKGREGKFNCQAFNLRHAVDQLFRYIEVNLEQKLSDLEGMTLK